MKVAITTKKELKDPKLEITINLEKGTTNFILWYQCPKCVGYGCRHGNGPCDDHLKLAPEDVLKTIGHEVRPMLESILQSILK